MLVRVMPRTCSICGHASREEIDRDIIAGKPYRDIAGRHAVSKSAVERHAGEHLAQALVRAAELEGRISADRLIAELRALRETTLGVLEEARSEANHGVALQAIARLEKQAELVGKLAGELVEAAACGDDAVGVDGEVAGAAWRDRAGAGAVSGSGYGAAGGAAKRGWSRCSVLIWCPR